MSTLKRTSNNGGTPTSESPTPFQRGMRTSRVSMGIWQLFHYSAIQQGNYSFLYLSVFNNLTFLN